MESFGKNGEAFSKEVFMEMISDFRKALSRAEAKICPLKDNLECQDTPGLAIEESIQRDKGKGRASIGEEEVGEARSVRDPLDLAGFNSAVENKGEKEMGLKSREGPEVGKARSVNSSPDSVENDRSTGEPYTQRNISESNGNAVPEDSFVADSPIIPPENLSLTHEVDESAGARLNVDDAANVPQEAEQKNEAASSLGLPEGLQNFLQWFEALDEESEKPDSSQTRWAKFWRRLKDQVLNEQVVPPDGWAKLWKRLRAADEVKVKDYKEDVDSLLILAGLFSAIVTAFLIAFYVALQPDSKDTTAFLVYQISLQLSTTFPISGQSLDAAQLSLPSFPFQIPASTIRINAVWFASLICALTTASFGILVKQWLREYMAIADMKPDRQCRVRYLREVSLYRWGVHHIASFLPLLLQGAIILFFVGLLDFARLLHPTIGGIVIAFVAVYLLFFVGTTLAPMVDPHCPYRTPFLNTALQLPRYLFYQARRSMHNSALRSNFLRKIPFRTRLLDMIVPDRYVRELRRFRLRGFDAFQVETGRNRRLDIPCMIAANAVLHDDDLAHSYELCLDDLPWKDAIESGPFPPQHTAVRSFLKKEDIYLFWQTTPPIVECPARLAISQYLGEMTYPGSTKGEETSSDVYCQLRAAITSYRLHYGDKDVFMNAIAPKLRDVVHRDDSHGLGVIRSLQEVHFDPRLDPLEWCSSPDDIDALARALCSFGYVKDLSELTNYGLQLIAMAARAVPAADQQELKRIISMKLSYLVFSSLIRTSECSFGVIQAINELANAGMEDILLNWCSSVDVISGLLDALGSPREVPNYYNRFDWSLIMKSLTTATNALSGTEREKLKPYFLRARPLIEQSIEVWITLGGTGEYYRRTRYQQGLDNLQKAVFKPSRRPLRVEKASPPTPPRQEIAQDSTPDYKILEQQLQEYYHPSFWD